MIVAMARVYRDRADVAPLGRGERVFARAIIQRDHDDAFRLGPQGFRMGATGERVGHPRHLAMAAFGEPFRQPLARQRRRLRLRHPAGVKSKFFRPRPKAG